jgi:type IV secretion system protein VirB2
MAANQSLPWEGPLDKIKDSLSGPVALAISGIATTVAGITLAFGGDVEGVFRKVVILVLVFSLLAFGIGMFDTLFGNATQGALMQESPLPIVDSSSIPQSQR